VDAPTTSITTSASDGVNEIQRIAFNDLKAGESIRVSGLTFTSGTAGTTKEQLKAIFVALAGAGATKTADLVNNAVGTTLTSDAIGRFTFGTHAAAGTYSSDTGPGEVKITAAVADTAGALNLNAAGTAAAPTATVNTETTPTSVFVKGRDAAPTSKSTETVTFKALGIGQSSTVNGLTFTAKAAMTDAQVAAAFASVSTGETAAQVTARNAASALLGTYTGTNTAGYASTTVSGGGNNVVVYTSVNDAAASFGQPTSIATPGKAPQAQVSTATFTDLDAGASVTFAGLTFTSGTAGTKAAELQAAFASIVGTSATTAQTFTQVNATAGALVSDAIGRFTSGTAVTGGTFAAGSSTGQVTWTALTASNDQTPLASAGSKESYVFTFSALKTGQSATINNLTFTAKKDLTSAEVASAFGSRPGISPTPANTANGDYSGSWIAGYETDAASGATVKATATAAGTANIAFSSSKFTDLVSSINAKTAETGVTATLASAGKVSLVSTKGIVLSGAAATSAEITALTGISGTAVASTAANTSTMRSAVTLSSTNAAGINLSGTTAAALAASGLTEESVVAKVTAGAGISSLDLTTSSGSQAALTTLDSAINTITDSRAAMGAYQNRLTASISNLETTSMNLSASRSRILDTDYAKETTNLAKSQIIQQAATAMLAQANQSGQSVLALLK